MSQIFTNLDEMSTSKEDNVQKVEFNLASIPDSSQFSSSKVEKRFSFFKF